MIAIVAIAIAAGAASALMFASIISGALISLVLFYLAPLPLMVAAIGWGPLSADHRRHRRRRRPRRAVRPALLHRLCHHGRAAGMVARPSRACSAGRSTTPRAGNGAAPVAPAMEWYPTGRLLLWIAGFAVAHHDRRPAHARRRRRQPSSAPMKRGLLRILGTARSAPPSNVERSIDALVVIAPGAAAIVAMMTLTINLWLAAQDHHDVRPAATRPGPI